MAKKLTLTIQEPCHENWNNMSPVEKGRFCGSCQKEVVDFSHKSDREIAEFFKKPASGSVCGRFMSDQLDREIIIPKKKLPWITYFFSVMLPALFVAKASGQRTVGKVASTQRDTARIPVEREIRTLGMVAPRDFLPVCKDSSVNMMKGQVVKKTPVDKVSKVVVNGNITDESNQPVQGANIRVVNSGKMFSSSAEGKFSFYSLKDQLIELEITSVGYEPQHYIYPFTLDYSSIVDLNIQMKTLAPQLDTVVVTTIGYTSCSRTVMGAISRVSIDSLITTTVPPELPVDNHSSILVYPNPVLSGNILHISPKNIEEGYYHFQLLDISGRMVMNRELWVDKEAGILDIQLPSTPSGTYVFSMINKKSGKKYSEKILVK